MRSGGSSLVAFAENRGSGYFQTLLTLESDCLRYSRACPNTVDWLPPGYAQIVQIAVPNSESGCNVSGRSRQQYKMVHAPPAPPWHSPEVGSDSGNFHAPFSLA